MEIKKLISFFFKHWQISSVFFCFLLAIWNIFFQYNPQWIMLTHREKLRIEDNYSRWRQLNPQQQKIWLEKQRRFQRYPFPIKEFIRLLYGNWLSFSWEEQEKRKKISQYLLALQPEEQNKILQYSIAMSCAVWEQIAFLPKEWNDFYKILDKANPVDCRIYVYYNFLIFHHRFFLPSPVYENWKETTAVERFKIIEKIQRKMDNYNFQQWLPFLRQSK